MNILYICFHDERVNIVRKYRSIASKIVTEGRHWCTILAGRDAIHLVFPETNRIQGHCPDEVWISQLVKAHLHPDHYAKLLQECECRVLPRKGKVLIK